MCMYIIAISPGEGYLLQAKFVVRMALLSWELNLVREDYGQAL